MDLNSIRMDPFSQLTNLSEEEAFALKVLEDKVYNSKEFSSRKQEEIDKNLLMVFLRCRKLDVDSAFKKFVGFQHARLHKYPHLFTNSHPKAAVESLKKFKVGFLKSKDKKGGAVFAFKLGDLDFDVISYEELESLLLFLGIHVHWDKTVQECGISLIEDCSRFSWKQARYITPTKSYQSLDALLTGLPWRINGVHHVNSSFVHKTIFSLFKMLCPKKLAERLHIHPNMESLHEHFDQNLLPEWLGGPLSHEEETADDRNILLDEETIKYYEQFICSPPIHGNLCY